MSRRTVVVRLPDWIFVIASSRIAGTARQLQEGMQSQVASNWNLLPGALNRQRHLDC